MFVPFSVDASATESDTSEHDQPDAAGSDATEGEVVGGADATETDAGGGADATETDAGGGADATETDASDGADATEIGVVGCPPTPSGTYFCALSFNLNRGAPIYLAMDLRLQPSGDMEVSAQPLVRDVEPDGGRMPSARTPVGAPLATQVVPYGDDGSFELTYVDQTIVGDANPVTFRDIVGTFELSGVFVSDDVAFGAMDGEVTSPTRVPLGGSTFACVRSDDFGAIDPVYYDETVPFDDAGCR